MKKLMIMMFICTLIGSSSFAQTQQDTSRHHKTSKQQKKNKRSKRDTSRTDTMRHQSTPPKS